MRILKKALPFWGAFFIALSLPVMAQCPSIENAEPVEIASVYDGDTVRLVDGRKIRIIGINAPETAKRHQPAEFMADRAAFRLERLLKQSDVSLVLGPQQRDRYQRWLGHLLVDGRLVSEQLLREGLAYHIAIPPNTRYWECLKTAEKQAVGTGVWSQGADIRKPVAELDDAESGFRVLTGLVTHARKIRNGQLVEIEGRLAVKIEVAEAAVASVMQDLNGKTVRVRGWVKPKKRSDPAHYMPWFLVIRHSSQLEVL